jgi:amylovoran biosynthesis glycosyltransferase AmsD
MSLTNQHHIAILCSRLDLPGGIERAVVNTANLFADKGHKVTLVVLDDTDTSFYPVHSSVTLIQHPLSFGITQEGNVISRKIKLLGDVLKLRRLLKELQPGLLVATEYPFAAAAILAGGKKHSKVIAWEHHHYYELQRNVFWNNIFRFTYPRLDAIVCLNADEQKLFASINNNPVVIPNCIEPAIKAELSNKQILTVARLTSVKGIDFLLAAAKIVLTKHPDWQWKLIGDGDMKEQVNNFISKEKLQGKLIIQPPVHHAIQPEYQQASLYVMTSRNECFPMTLLEAQAAGLPCIAFDCDSGPRHIIINNENGLLIEKENPVKIAEAVSFLITNEDERKNMGEKAFADVQRFSPENVYKLWKKLL